MTKRTLVLLILVVLTTALVTASGCGRTAPKEPDSGAATPEATPPLTDPPPTPPFKLTDDMEKRIDSASDRHRIYVENRESSQKYLDEFQVKLSKCDEANKQKSDMCLERQATMYCALIGDRYRELGDDQSAVAFYLEALDRTEKLNKTLKDEYEQGMKSAEDPKLAADAKTAIEAYQGAKYHFQSYKDFAEMARYRKRLVEVAMAHKRTDTAADRWVEIEKDIKTSADHLRKFQDSVDLMKTLTGHVPDGYQDEYDEAMRLTTAVKIERI